MSGGCRWNRGVEVFEVAPTQFSHPLNIHPRPKNASHGLNSYPSISLTTLPPRQSPSRIPTLPRCAPHRVLLRQKRQTLTDTNKQPIHALQTPFPPWPSLRKRNTKWTTPMLTTTADEDQVSGLWKGKMGTKVMTVWFSLRARLMIQFSIRPWIRLC